MKLNHQTLLDRSPQELAALFLDLKLPKFAAKQVLDWVYKKHVLSYEAMTNLSKAQRQLLSEQLPFPKIKVLHRLRAGDGTVKYVFQLEDHHKVEAVVLQEKEYKTLCVSSQSGCPVDCKFCLTGVAGFKRQLSSGEILAQLLWVMSEGHQISHLVFMGMGEPLLNFDNVFKAIAMITNPDGFGISKRKITVSTSGILQGIRRLISEDININLAFSVGNPNPGKRAKIMPIEQRNPIMEISQLLREYLKKHNRMLTLEYTLLEGVNDGDEECLELGNLAKFLHAKVNVINLNPHPKIPFKPVSSEKLISFHRRLRAQGIHATVRQTKGREVVAACGQLGESILPA